MTFYSSDAQISLYSIFCITSKIKSNFTSLYSIRNNHGLHSMPKEKISILKIQCNKLNGIAFRHQTELSPFHFCEATGNKYVFVSSYSIGKPIIIDFILNISVQENSYNNRNHLLPIH